MAERREPAIVDQALERPFAHPPTGAELAERKGLGSGRRGWRQFRVDSTRVNAHLATDSEVVEDPVGKEALNGGLTQPERGRGLLDCQVSV